MDDDESSRHLARQLLKRTGFARFTEARDGIEGLEGAARGEHDLILLDLQMPRMDGWAALPRIHAAQPKTPIIVVSGMEVDEGELRRLGASAFISKACCNADFVAKLETVLARAS